MINKWIGIGNLGADPEMRRTAGGQSVCNLRLACNERFKGKDGEWADRTEWVPVVVWGNSADACSRFLRKGSRAYVEGRIQARGWEKDGQERWTTEIVAQTVKFLDSRQDAGNPPQPRKSAADGPGGNGIVPDDEVPF